MNPIPCEHKLCKTEQPDARLYEHPTARDFIGQPVNRFFCEACVNEQVSHGIAWRKA